MIRTSDRDRPVGSAGARASTVVLRAGALVRLAFDWLLPPLCIGCRSTPADGIDALNLCPSCRAACRPIDGRRCPGCLLPIEDPSAAAGYRCGSCRRRPPPWARLLAGWRYESPFEAVIVGLKFGRLDFLGSPLGRALVERHHAALGSIDAVVPLPLHRRRDWQRGYNQAERIAAPIANRLERPLVPALVRTRATAPQTGLDRRQRAANVRGAFVLRRRHVSRVEGRHMLLVDDVLTTGATLDSATRALLRGGAEQVTALVAAHTHHPMRPRGDG